MFDYTKAAEYSTCTDILGGGTGILTTLWLSPGDKVKMRGNDSNNMLLFILMLQSFKKISRLFPS